MELSKNLKSYREASGLSQKQVSKVLHIARQSISRWELGKAAPTEENLAALAKVYGVTVDELRYGTQKEEPSSEEYAGKVANCGEKKYRMLLLFILAAMLLFGLFFRYFRSAQEDEQDEHWLSEMQGVEIEPNRMMDFGLEW